MIHLITIYVNGLWIFLRFDEMRMKKLSKRDEPKRKGMNFTAEMLQSFDIHNL